MRLKKFITGFTLVEAIIAIAVIGGGLIGVMYAFNSSTKASILTERTVVASFLTREKLERIVADRSTKGYAATIATNYSDGQLTGNFSAFSRNVSIVEVDPDLDAGVDSFLDPLAGSGYARVTVAVTYGTETVKLETLIADYTIP